MHRHQRIIVIAVVALIAVSGLTFGLVKAYAQGQTTLPSITAADLLAKVVDPGSRPSAVSGDLEVTNDLLGLPAEFALGGSGGFSALLQSGKGRVWVQDGKARIEAQSQGGDTVVYYDGENVTLYDSAANSLTKYSLPGAAPAASTSSTVFDPRTTIPQIIERLAPVAGLAVSGQERVAGRDCYVLTLTPTAQNTLFGSLQIAVDGKTFLPLRLTVFAKGTMKPAFSAGFTSISYDSIADSIFAVPNPPGAKIEQKELKIPSGLMSGTADADAVKSHPKALTLAEAGAKAGFTVLAPQTAAAGPAFKGAYVIELPAELGATSDGAGMLGGALGALSRALPPGPVVVLLYGDGFETLVMVQAKVTAASAAMQQLLTGLPFVGKTTVNGAPGFQLTTPLLSLVGWHQGSVDVIVAGSVPQADLTAFAAGVR